VGGGYRLVTRPDVAPWLVKLARSRTRSRLSRSSLETLAIVAYRQPVTKGGVERIRGVDSDYTMRALLHRRLIVELGRSETPGRPYLYGTDFAFLERFGIASLEELPPLDADVAARLIETVAAEPAPDATGPEPPPDAAGRQAQPAEPGDTAPNDDGRGPGIAVGPGPS
jgi:segregation and condensation protein B